MPKIITRPRSLGRRFLAMTLATAAVSIVTGVTVSTNGDVDAPAPAAIASDHRAIAHVLNRIGFGPRPGDIERVREIGVEAYIEQQLHPDRISDSQLTARLAEFRTLQLSTREIAQQYFLPAQMARRRLQQERAARPDGKQESTARSRDQRAGSRTDAPQGAMARGSEMSRDRRRVPEEVRNERLVLDELVQQKLLRALYSERQLEEVLVDFWFNHFNVFAGKGLDRIFLTEYEREAIRPHALGKFRDLLGAVAESPAMLFYLDNWMSSDPNGPDLQPIQRERQRRRIFNRPRRPFGRDRPRDAARRGDQRRPAPSPRRRPGGLNENYARELLELHTLGVEGGYTQKDVVEVARAFTGWTIDQPRQGGSFRFESQLHDAGDKVVLGHTIKAGGGRSDGEQVLDILARHPSTARFIATKLARRFVADDPPDSLVDRAAARFLRTDGDVREVVRTIVTSPEFFSAEAYRAKVKTPLEFVASALRITSARVNNAGFLVRALRELGMPPYFCQPPTGYADRADAWVNTGALLNRMNFAVALVSNRFRGVAVDLGAASGSEDPDLSRQWLVNTVLLDDASDATRATLERSSNVGQLAALAIGAPEFQRR